MNETNNVEAPKSASNFIKAIINEDLKTNKYEGRVHTRFPPRAKRILAHRSC